MYFDQSLIQCMQVAAEPRVHLLIAGHYFRAQRERRAAKRDALDAAAVCFSRQFKLIPELAVDSCSLWEVMVHADSHVCAGFIAAALLSAHHYASPVYALSALTPVFDKTIVEALLNCMAHDEIRYAAEAGADPSYAGDVDVSTAVTDILTSSVDYPELLDLVFTSVEARCLGSVPQAAGTWGGTSAALHLLSNLVDEMCPSQWVPRWGKMLGDSVGSSSLEFTTPRTPGENDGRCKSCGTQQPKLLVCSRCEGVRYCSAECQRRDWKEHKPSCGKELRPCLEANPAGKTPGVRLRGPYERSTDQPTRTTMSSFCLEGTLRTSCALTYRHA